MTLLLAFLFWLPKLTLGFFAAHKLWRENKASALALQFFLAIPLGLGFSSLFFFAWLWLGLPAKLYPPLEALAVCLCYVGQVRDLRNVGRAFGLPAQIKDLRHILALTGLALFFFFRSALHFPHGYEDAWFIWNMAARFLYRAADWTLRFSAQSTLWHPDYPLLIPLNVAQGWFALGESTRIPLSLAALFTFAIPGLIFSALNFSGQKTHALSAAGLILLTPWFIEFGTQQMADIPLAAYFLGAGISFWLFQRQGELRLLALSGLLAGFSAWTKNEGWLFWIFLALILFFTTRRWEPLRFFLLASLPPLTAALAFKFFLAPANDLFAQNANRLQQILDPARWEQILAAFGQQISAFGGWRLGIFWVLLAYTLLTGFDRSALRHNAKLWALVLLQLSGYFAIYLITPHDLDWHLRTSLARLLMQVFPLTLFALFTSLKALET